jgi:hypothetical protein
VHLLRIPRHLPGERGHVTIEPAARLARVEARDRLGNLAILTAAGVVWLLALLILFTRDPIDDPSARFIGAALIGLAVGLTAMPLAWLIVFARHRRIAYRGDWTRAVRRGAWAGLFVAVLILLRLEGVLALPIVLFMLALIVVAEMTLSAER